MCNIIYQNHKKYGYARVSIKREANSSLESQKQEMILERTL